MRIFYAFAGLLFVQILKAQVVRQPLTVHYTGLGAYSKNFADVFSSTSNHASLAGLKTGSFGVYGENRFMLSELSSYTAVVAIPTSSGTIGFRGDYFGFENFNESQLGIIYARKVSEHVDVGVKFNYHTVRIAGYGSASAVNFEAGAIFHLNEQMHAGVHLYNPTSSKLGKKGAEKLASVYKLGLGYEASKKVFVSGEIVKQEDQQVGVNAGLQYNIHERVFLRTGVATAGNNTYAGVGLQLSVARIDVNAAYHPQLGFTPGLLVLLRFSKIAED